MGRIRQCIAEVAASLCRFAFATALIVFGPSAFAHSADPASDDYFEQQVRPIFKTRCFQCHSHEVAKPKGDFLLDSPEAVLAGGESGIVVVPSKPEKSSLLDSLKHLNGLKMPQNAEKLPAEEIAIIEKWITAGAKGAKVSANVANGPTKRGAGKITAADKQWWAFQPVAKVAPPKVQNDGWVRHEIDRFVLARLEKEGLTPSPEASRSVLVRRLYFDMWGLPPSPEEVAAFVNDTSDAAYEKLVDRLLESPHYGEKWARQWLDLVRYADSDGYRLDDFRPHAWRFRDYVIRALNTDKPYDRFVKEQLAGDELYPDDPDAQIATGYLCHWIYEYNSRDAEGQWRTILNDITDTTGDVFLGLGLQCARCHDHKFDPILQKDYFRLQAFFAPLHPYAERVVASQAELAQRVEKTAAYEQATAKIRAEIDALEKKYLDSARKEAVGKFPEETKAMINKAESERTPYEQQIAELALRQATYEYQRIDRKYKAEDKEKILALRRQLIEFDKQAPPQLPLAMVATDVGHEAPPTTIPKKSGEPVAPGFPTVLQEEPAEILALPDVPNSTGRRATLANWLTQADNPLTPRVVANRVWQAHFGRGLAANTADFGKLGEQPTHPELLDWLAARFVSDGWSLKKLHRTILLSATYRQAVNHPQAEMARKIDPENRLNWRANTRRLEAEQIRDALLAVSGELKLDLGGPGVGSQDPRRTVYCKIMRNTRDSLLDVFDAPLWFQSASSRDSTTTPVQSLMLFNSQFMLKRAEAFVARIEKEVAVDKSIADKKNTDKQVLDAVDEKRIVRAYQLALGREPTIRETAAAKEFFLAQEKTIDLHKTQSAEAAFVADKMPQRDGQSASFSPKSEQNHFEIPHHKLFPAGDFTIEAFVLPKSVYETGSVRTIAAKWDGDVKHPGWSFGITGKKSRRKPQTVVMQIFGKKQDGSFGEAAVFSDQSVQLNKPYFISVVVELARDGKEGKLTFHIKDLSNDDEPLLTATTTHEIVGDFANELPFTIGGRTKGESYFDGLIDDVRLSNEPLSVQQLLFTSEGVKQNTIGYWQFEAKPDVLHDTSPNALHIQPTVHKVTTPNDVHRTAWRDFCHVLLNSNEFLYTE